MYYPIILGICSFEEHVLMAMHRMLICSVSGDIVPLAYVYIVAANSPCKIFRSEVGG